ncbi:hypothetical protein ppKF707_2919 [Metapseudomonas furukawaii]|nr:hypothetical protein ppKF707_2919 [Pseudomonas furukawaii]
MNVDFSHGLGLLFLLCCNREAGRVTVPGRLFRGDGPALLSPGHLHPPAG